MTDISSISSQIAGLGLTYKSVTKVATNPSEESSVSAKFAALQKEGSELIIKGDDNNYYLVELDDSTTLDNLKLKLHSHPSSVIGINFVDKSKNDTIGSLYTIDTLEGGSVLDRATAASTPKTGEFYMATGDFNAKITDNNGITVNGKDDVEIDITAKANVKDSDIEKFANNLLSGSGISVKVKISGSGNVDFSLKLDQSAKDKIKSQLLVTPLDTIDKLSKGKLSKEFDLVISIIEEQLKSSFTPNEIASLLSGKGGDGLVQKFKDMLKLKRGDLEKPIQDAVKNTLDNLPDVLAKPLISKANGAIKTIADGAEKVYDVVADNAKAKLESYLKPDSTASPDSTKELIKEVSRIGRYTLSDSSLNNIQTNVKGHVSGGALILEFSATGKISSDDSKGIVAGSKDSLGVNGGFSLGSKGSISLHKAGLGVSASIDNTKLSHRQIVAMSESAGSKGNIINTALLRGKASLSGSLTATADISPTGGVLAKVQTKVDKFTEDNFGTDISVASASFDVEHTDKPFSLDIKSEGKLSLDKAVLISKNIKVSKDVVIKKAELTGSYEINPERISSLHTDLLATGLDEKTVSSIIPKLKGDTKKDVLEKRVDSILSDLKIDKENQPKIKELILKSIFSPPSLDKANVHIDSSTVSISGSEIKTGLNLSAQVGDKKGGLILKRVKIKEGDIVVGLDDKTVRAKAKDIVISNLTVSSGGKLMSVSSLHVVDGNAEVDTKNGLLSASAKGSLSADVAFGGSYLHIDAQGKSSLSASKDKGKFDVHLTSSGTFSGKAVVTIDKNKKEEIEFSGKTGNLDLDATQSKVTFKASGKDSKFKVKSQEHNLDIEFNIPNGVIAEFDIKSKTLKLKGSDGKEFQASQVIKDYSGKLIADISIKAKGDLQATFDKGNITINPPEGGVEIDSKIRMGDKNVSIKGTFNGKVSIDTEKKKLAYDTIEGKDNSVEIETKDKKFSAKTSSGTSVNIDLINNGDGVELQAGGTPDKPVEVDIKSETTKYRTVDTDLKVKISDKAKISIDKDPKSPDSKIIKITPPAGSVDKPGISISGRLDTGVGILDIDNLGISAEVDNDGKPKESQLSISKEGLSLNGEAGLNITGKLGVSGDGDTFKDVKFDGKANLTKLTADFNKMSIDVSAGFDGTVKGHKVKISGGLTGTKDNVHYEASGALNGSHVNLGGNISSKIQDNELIIDAKSTAAISIGTDTVKHYNIEATNVKIPLSDAPLIFSGDFKLDSSDKTKDDKLESNGKLAISANVSLVKTDIGYKFSIKGGNLESKDGFEALMIQVTSIMKQPQVAEQLAKKGIKIEDIEQLHGQLQEVLSDSYLKASSDLEINIGNDLAVKNVKVQSANAIVPIGGTKSDYYSIDLTDLVPPILNKPTLFSAKLNIESGEKTANNKFKKNDKLSVSASLSFEKTVTGYTFRIDGNLKSKDCLEALVTQVTSIMKQPQFAEMLDKKGIKTKDIEKIQSQLKEFLVASDFEASSKVDFHLGSDFSIKDIEIKNADIDSVKVSVPMLTHTKELGLKIVRPYEKMTFEGKPVSLSDGKVDMNAKQATGKLAIDLNVILPQILDRQFNHPDSPVKDKVNFVVEGGKIQIIANGKKSPVNFGLKDLEISIKDNKLQVNIKYNLWKSLYDTIGFAFKGATDIDREMTTLLGMLGSPKNQALKTDLGFDESTFTLDIPQMMKDKNMPSVLGGPITILNGKVTIPVKSNF